MRKWIACAIALSACASDVAPRAPDFVLAVPARATVVVFFSDHCPCMRAHDARLVALANEYAAKDVRFVAIDSEVGATLAHDRAEANERHYPFPILVDDGAHVARSLGAEYATYTVIFDASGNVVYRGGLDGDHTHLSEPALSYVRDALDDVVVARAVRRSHTEPLGCALRLW